MRRMNNFFFPFPHQNYNLRVVDTNPPRLDLDYPTFEKKLICRVIGYELGSAPHAHLYIHRVHTCTLINLSARAVTREKCMCTL